MPTPYYTDGSVTIYHADCFDMLHELSGIGAVVTDPPYSSGGAFRGDRAQTTFIDWRQLPVLTDAVQAGGWTWRNLATWWKPGTRMQKGRFSSSAEYVVYATNGPVVEGAGSPQNVYSCKIDRDREHIAQKPAKVMQWVLGAVNPGALILDPFMGSGATLEAAANLGHRAIGIEVDERYCETAAKRFDQGVLNFGEAA